MESRNLDSQNITLTEEAEDKMCQEDHLLNKHFHLDKLYPDEFSLQCDRLGGKLPFPESLQEAKTLHDDIQATFEELEDDLSNCLDNQENFIFYLGWETRANGTLMDPLNETQVKQTVFMREKQFLR